MTLHPIERARTVLERIFPSDFSSVEEKSKNKILSIFLTFIVIALFILGADLLAKGIYTYGISDIAAGCVLASFIIALRYTRNSIMIYRAALILMGALFFYWIKNGAINGYASIWILDYPPFSFFLTGRREGLLWTMIMAGLTIIVFTNPYSFIDAWNYPPEYSIRHIIALLVISLFSFYYELDRKRFKYAIRQEQALLIIEKEYLASAKAEVEKVNIRLKDEIEFRKQTEEELRIHRDNLEDLVNDRTRELQHNILELEKSEKRYRLVTNNVTDVIWSMDLNFKVMFISPAVTAMYGYTVEESIKVPLDAIQPPESVEKIRKVFLEQVQLEKTEGADPERNVVLQLMQRHKNGTLFEVEIRVSFLRNDSGQPIGLVGITRDISERVRIQREKDQIQEQLAQAQKMESIGTLVGGLAHDFNNVLSGIIGSLDLIRTLLKNEHLENREEIDKYLNVGMDSAMRSVSLIKELLSLSRKHEIRLEPIDLNEAVNHIYDICCNSFPKSIELNFRFSPVRPVIMGDMAQMGQVLLNLCINASHSMTIMKNPNDRQGGVLSVKVDTIPNEETDAMLPVSDVSPSNGWVRLTISDTGVGMDRETIAHMYEPFFSKDKPGIGSGLGLSISYNIIQKHNGIIQIESEPGVGSFFTLYFPFCQDVPCRDMASEKHAMPERGEGTILVIDDEQMVLKVAKGFLEQCGYSVITTEEPDRGIQLFRERHPDISAVIIDLSMPGKTGLEVYRALRLINPGVRAILSSGMLDSDSKEQALALGIMDFVNKPYLADELSARIKGLLSRS